MPRFRFENPWRLSWQAATSDTLLATVLVALALALLVAAWLPQSSSDALSSDVTWQAEVQRRFGGVAWFDTLRSPLQTLGAFHVIDTVGFRLALALLALALLVRLVDSIDVCTDRLRGADDEPVAADEEQDRRIGTQALGRAGRLPWADLGSVGLYLGALVILAGAAVTNVSSWQTGAFPLAPGESAAVGNGDDLTLRLLSLDPDGRHGVGELWRAGDTLVGAGDMAVGKPLGGDGIGAYLVGSGRALRIQATSGDGGALGLVSGADTVAREDVVLTFTQDEPRHLVGVPEADLVLLLAMPEATDRQARFRVQVFAAGSGEFILEQEAPQDTALTVGEVSFALTPMPYAEVRVVHDRGAFWSQLGAIGLVAGAVLRALFSSKGWWFRRRTHGGGSAGAADPEDGAEATPSAGTARPSKGGAV